MEDLFKKVMLLGIGTMAKTYEKANLLVNELIEKGQITVNQGEKLNKELKRIMDNDEDNNDNMKSYIDNLNLATKSDIENLKKRIENLEKKLNGGI